MILVTGGSFQGKRKFAEEILEERFWKNDRYDHFRSETIWADGNRDSFEMLWNCPCIDQFHVFIRRLAEEQAEISLFTERLIQAKPWIVVMDEVGCGVVPIEAVDREYREQAGRAAQRLAAEASEVYRVVCGIGIRMK